MKPRLQRTSTIVPSSAGGGGSQGKAVVALAYSACGGRLAVATADRAIALYGCSGAGGTAARLDKFRTRGAGPITAMEFGPDPGEAPRLAVVHPDAVLVYTWCTAPGEVDGPEDAARWGKKKLRNKFPSEAAIGPAVAWRASSGDVAFGLSTGSVMMGDLRKNRATEVHQGAGGAVVALAPHPGGADEVMSAHSDGSVYRHNLSRATSSLVLTHPGASALAWGRSILVAGKDRVAFYDSGDGSALQIFACEAVSETATFHRAGNTAVVGTFDCIHSFSWDLPDGGWTEGKPFPVQNMGSVTGIAWRSDCSRLAVAAECGLVDAYRVDLRKYIMHGKRFEVTHGLDTMLAQVTDREHPEKLPLTIQSKSGIISKIRFHETSSGREYRYITAVTNASIIIVNLENDEDAVEVETPWEMMEDPKETISFQGEVCIIRHAKGIAIFEDSNLLCSVSTPCAMQSSFCEGAKTLAYLSNKLTIIIRNLTTSKEMNIPLDESADFVELSSCGTYALFRDMGRQLHLFDCKSGHRTMLLSEKCGYAQWVPERNVVVAQSEQNTMSIWYNIHAPDQIVTRNIKGDIRGIEKCGSSTVRVVLDVGGEAEFYTLDEGFINLWNTPGPKLDEGGNTKIRWLIDTRQYIKAAYFQEEKGDITSSISLLLDGGYPFLASEVFVDNKIEAKYIMRAISDALEADAEPDKARHFLEMIGQHSRVPYSFSTSSKKKTEDSSLKKSCLSTSSALIKTGRPTDDPS